MSFDPLTGEVRNKLARYHLPKTHYVTPGQTILDAIDSIKIELKERLEYFREHNLLVEAQRLVGSAQLFEMMQELGYYGH